MITINLLPVREERRKSELRGHAGLVVVLIVLGLALVGVQHAALTSKVSQKHAEVSQLKKEQDNYKSQLKEVEAFKEKKKGIQAKLDVITKLNQIRSGPVRILDELAMRTPEKVSLKRLETGKNGVITLSGLGLNNKVVAGYLDALEESSYFGDVRLDTIKRKNEGGLKVSTFEINAKLESPDPKKKTKKTEKGEEVSSNLNGDRTRGELAG